MLTGRRFWMFSLVFVLAIVTVTAGCRRRSGSRTTINQGGADIFTTDEFPGDDVQNGNVADDQRAMSVSGDDFSSDTLKCTMNGNRGTAMVTYNTDDDGTWVQHYDGSTWTPPVSLRALDLSSPSAETTDDIIHAFINTDGNDNDFAADRNGDCIIVWRGRDVDTAGDGDVDGDNDNVCVFMTYFDATHHSEAGARYGFQEFATRINSHDELEENVSTIAVVTDGLCGEADWGDGVNDYEYGDDTTSIEIVFRIDENNDADNTVPNEDVALWSARVDLESAIDAEIPLGVSVLTRLGVVGFGASDGGTDSEETQVMEVMKSYNNVLVFMVLSNDARGADEGNFDTVAFPFVPGADDDVTLQYVTYDLATGGITGVTDLNPGAVDSTADGFENNAALLEFNAAQQTIFGTDEGLAVTTIWYLILVENAAATSTPANSARVAMAEIDQADGSLDSISLVNVDDIDEDEFISPSNILVEISRNGDYVWAAWMQEDDITAGDDASDGLWVASYVTTRPDDDGAFVLPSTVDSLSLSLNVATALTTEEVLAFQFQHNLGYICGIQSNADIMSVFFQQSDGTNDEWFQVELTADLVLPTGPSTTTFSFESFEDGDHQFNDENSSANFNEIAFTDSGFDGFIFAGYYDDVDGTATDDYRLFAERTGPFSAGVVEIDSAVSFRQSDLLDDGSDDEELISLPRGEEIGSFDTSSLEDDERRHHGASRIHVFMFEDRETETYDVDTIRTREFVTEDNGNTMGDNFLPNAGTSFVEPFAIEHPGGDPDETPNLVGNGQQGEVLGIWFEFESHIYYQQNSGGSDPDDGDSPESVGWNVTGDPGVSNPFLVDDDNDEEINEFVEFCQPACSCDDLDGSTVFWTKAFGSGSGGGQSFRLQVRVLNGE